MKMVDLDHSIRGLIGQEYVVTSRFENEETEFVREAFECIHEINEELFSCIPYNVIFTEEDPYKSSKQMRQEVLATGNIRIYTGWSGHPFLSFEQNIISRAVHDVYAHIVCKCPFTFEGEVDAHIEQRQHYPEWVWGTLFAEGPAQTAAFYHAKGFSYKQRAFEAPRHWLVACNCYEEECEIIGTNRLEVSR